MLLIQVVSRAPPPPMNEGGMVEGGNVKLACSLLKMSKLESFYSLENLAQFERISPKWQH